MTDVFIAGAGLACALGDSLTACTTAVAAGDGPVEQPALIGDRHWPYLAREDVSAQDAATWEKRADALIVQVVAEACGSGDTVRDGPLFIASSSLSAGGLERGTTPLQDAMAVAEKIGASLAWRGPVVWVSTACTSSINALLCAKALLQQTDFEEALVLGLELANLYTLRGFSAMQLLSSTHAQPLGATRDGLVLGEAVAALRISRKYTGWRITSGACVVSGKDATSASEDAVVKCWTRCLEGTERIDVLKLQAAGSPGNDAIELGAVNKVFSEAPALASLKHLCGHTLGAAGAAEIALFTACIDGSVWPRCDVPHDTQLAHSLASDAPSRTDSMLASIIGFGGGHAALQLRRDEPACIPSQQGRCFEVIARHDGSVPANWLDELVQLLGERPRRLGAWAELALWGALRCLQSAGMKELPSGVSLRLCTMDGPRAALLRGLDEIVEYDVPMPFTFLQSQPGQVLASLARALEWSGDARIVSSRDAALVTLMACAEAGPEGVLLGWLDEALGSREARSRWMLLRPHDDQAAFDTGTPAPLESCRYLRIHAGHLQTV